jgi:putative Holliday junction resolvase
MGRLMSIDYGEKRIGIALSDALKMFANPFTTLNNVSLNDVFKELQQIVDEQKVEKIIVGLPLNLSSEDTKKTQEVRLFFFELSQKISLPMVLFDERYSTTDANEILKQKGYDWKKSRDQIDQVAAAVILQTFIDTN